MLMLMLAPVLQELQGQKGEVWGRETVLRKVNTASLFPTCYCYSPPHGEPSSGGPFLCVLLEALFIGPFPLSLSCALPFRTRRDGHTMPDTTAAARGPVRHATTASGSTGKGERRRTPVLRPSCSSLRRTHHPARTGVHPMPRAYRPRRRHPVPPRTLGPPPRPARLLVKGPRPRD